MSKKIYKKKTNQPDSAYVLVDTVSEEITSDITAGLEPNTAYTFKIIRSLPGYRDSAPRYVSFTTQSNGNVTPAAPFLVIDNDGNTATITMLLEYQNKEDYEFEFIEAPNVAPTVNLSIDDSSITTAEQAILTATPSDSDGTISKVEFYRGATLLGQVTTAPYIWNVNGLTVGSYSFTANAYDDDNAVTTSNAVTLTVTEVPNVAPVASAGSDNTITLPTNSVTLTGSGTDSDGSIASYAWTKVSGTGGTITNPTAATTTVTELTEGGYVFRLTVTDDDGATHTDDVQVTVIAAAATLPFLGYAHFDGVNDYISIPHSTQNGNMTTVTILFKARFTGTTNTVVLEKGGTNGHYRVQTTAAGVIPPAGRMIFGVNAESTYAATPVINNGNWHTMGFIYNAATTITTCYADGALSTTAGGTATAGNTSPWMVGSRAGAAAFAGDMSNLLFYNRALTLAEFQAFEAGNPPTDYIGAYPFNGNANDISVNANHGTIGNETTFGTF